MSRVTPRYNMRDRAHRTSQKSGSLASSPDLSFLDDPWYAGQDDVDRLLEQRRMQHTRGVDDTEYLVSEYEEASEWESPDNQESFIGLLKTHSLELLVFTIVTIFLFEIPLRLPFMFGFFISIPSVHLMFTPGSISSKLASHPEPKALYRRFSSANAYAPEQEAPIPGTLLNMLPPAAGIALFNPATWFTLPIDRDGRPCRNLAHTNFHDARFQPYRTWREALSDTLCSVCKSGGGFAWNTIIFQFRWRLVVLITRLLLAAWNKTAHEWQLPDTREGLRELLMPNLYHELNSHVVTFCVDRFVWFVKLFAVFFYFLVLFYCKVVVNLGRLFWLAVCAGAGWVWRAVVQSGVSPGEYVDGTGMNILDGPGNGVHYMHAMRTVYAASVKM